ncbi:MAG: hypothetical protein GXP49_12315, partial [Deltaproteobacteria bacterium]|nr:hypothetical protein [Deltaproteobacteria bacterium]
MTFGPFGWIARPRRRSVFAASVGLAVLLMACLSGLDTHIKGHASPMGIVSFELAGDMHTVELMLEAWA